jgi:hypothetical protein
MTYFNNITNLITFYVVIQISEHYLVFLIFNFLVQNYYYLCTQEVEDELGTAGEQPASNKLPVLRSNAF